MAIVKANSNRSFQSTLRYVTQKATATLFANIPEALGCEKGQEVCDEVSATMEQLAAESSKCQKPCYHISISPDRKDLPIERDIWSELVDKFLVLTGLEDNQAVAYLHEDTTYPDGTERPHAHLIVNRVGDDGRAIDTSWDYYRFQTAMRVLEEQFEWQHQPCSWEVDKRRDTSGQVQRLQRERAEYERGDRRSPPTPAMRSQLADAVEQAIAESTTMQGIEQFLKPLGIQVHHHQEEKDKLGWSFECDGFHFAGWQLGRNFSQFQVNKRLKTEELELKNLARAAQRQSDGQRLLQGLQALAPQEFEKASGEIHWEDSTDFSYRFEIGSSSDGTVQIQGFAADSEVELFRASILDGAIDIQKLAISASTIAQLPLDDFSVQQVVEHPVQEGSSAIAAEDSTVEVTHSERDPKSTEQAVDGPVQTDWSETAAQEPTVETTSDTDYTIVFNSSDENGSTKFATFKADGDWVVETAEDRHELTADDDLEATAISSQSDNRHENFSGVPTAVMIAETLLNYAYSRASFYKDIDYTEPIPSTLGTISVQADSDDTLVSICDEDNSTKFAAFKIDGDWVVQTDELINSERKRIQSVPQTPEDYVVQAHGKCVMDALLKMAPQEFERDQGGVRLPAKNGDFDYRFNIDRNADGDVQVVGFDSQSEEIFKASLTDGAMNIYHCQIPRDNIDAILAEADNRAKKQSAPRQQKELQPKEELTP